MTAHKENNPNSTYSVGEVVPFSGIWKYGVNGERMEFEKGEDFPEGEPATDAEAKWELVEKY